MAEECHKTVDRLFHVYKDNEYMLQRIYCHIAHNLPNTLENEAKNYEKRLNLTSYLSEEQQIFMQVFLSKNNYYYLHNNSFFYEYNGKDYFIMKEDDIIHKLLSAISKDRVLLQWKHKTKLNVLRKIKERNLFQSIPETDTIQEVLNALYPSIFSSKSVAKYFLTIIGDNILKKNNNIQFLVSPKMKLLLAELEAVAISCIGSDNISSHFITKYHENHSYENLRLIKIQDNYSNDYWREMLKKVGLNLLCVATHYSNRYSSSDNYLDGKTNEDLTDYAYTLKNTTQAEMLKRFVSECLETTTDEFQIEWKNLHFIWKQFLSSIGLPNVIFSTTLKNCLSEMLNYDKENDAFKGITSKYLPFYRDFIKFWDTTIVQNVSYDFENDFEIDEICSLFKMWSKNRTNLTEDTIIKFLKHSFPYVEIVEDKYLLNVNCTLWDKISDINHSLQYFNDNIKNDYQLSLISFDDIYNCYQGYCAVKSIKFIVSKRYFEKYLNFKFADNIVYEKFVKVDCILY
jgi:hypothetical protein